jgi:hypothetical protein
MSWEDREAKREIERYVRIHGPQPMGEKQPDGTIRIANLETPMAFAQRMERRRRMALGYLR